MEEDETFEDGFTGYPCYEFNPRLEPSVNDTRCVHCRKYLTTACDYIDEFLEDEGNDT